MKLTPQDIGFAFLAALATVLLCLGVTSGSGLSVILYFLSAVPLMVVTLGWGLPVGLVGAAIATVIILFAANPQTAIFIVTTTIGPAVLSGFLMNLARPAEEVGGPAGKMVWYPLADVIFRMAIITGLAFIVAGALIGYGPELINPLIGEFVVRYQEVSPEFQGFSPEALAQFQSFILFFLPFFQSMMWTMVLVANLAIALSITRRSGRLKRPADDWAFALRLPRMAVVVFCLALLASFVSGTIGLAANAILGALAGGFIIAGFALMHAAVRGQPWAPFAIIMAYLSTVMLGLRWCFSSSLACSRLRARCLSATTPTIQTLETRLKGQSHESHSARTHRQARHHW
ncbi:MAG: DUF2232 domain-containing protein [Pseudomonadota bacterium]